MPVLLSALKEDTPLQLSRVNFSVEFFKSKQGRIKMKGGLTVLG